MLFLLIFDFMTSSSFAMDNYQMMHQSDDKKESLKVMNKERLCNQKKHSLHSRRKNQLPKRAKKITMANNKRIVKPKQILGWRIAPTMQKLSESKTTFKKK